MLKNELILTKCRYRILQIILYGCFVLLLSACATLDKTQNNNFDKSSALAMLALGYLNYGDHVQAHYNLQQAIKYSPDHLAALLTMAYYHEIVKEVDAAQNLYSTILQKYPNNPKALNNYAVFLCNLEQYQVADQYFKQIFIQTNYLNIGASYENAGICILRSELQNKEQLAYHYFSCAIAHDPQLQNSGTNLKVLESSIKNR